MTEDRRRTPSGPTQGTRWGTSHLALDAVVAFVDEELSPGARRRALAHLAGCPECAAEVVAQTQARLALRAAATPSLPSSLMHTLRDIPIHAELPAAPAGLAVGPDGEIVSVLRAPGSRRRPGDRRVRIGAGAVVSGLALGALFATGGAELVPDAATAAQPPDSGATAPRAAVGASMRFGGSAPAGGTAVGTPAVAPLGTAERGPVRAVPVVDPVPGSLPVVDPAPGSLPVDPVPGSLPVDPVPGSLPVDQGAGSVPQVAVVPAISLPHH